MVEGRRAYEGGKGDVHHPHILMVGKEQGGLHHHKVQNVSFTFMGQKSMSQ